MVMIVLFQKAHALDFFCSVYYHISKKLSLKLKSFSNPLNLYLYLFSIQLCDMICGFFFSGNSYTEFNSYLQDI